mmetsp:Transcript_17585/g.16813  ORF Transcript_17585/g.16813 Transcript_17585/m.16813 type:complete len:142 (+) Transcript_17585:508-933(+)
MGKKILSQEEKVPSRINKSKSVGGKKILTEKITKKPIKKVIPNSQCINVKKLKSKGKAPKQVEHSIMVLDETIKEESKEEKKVKLEASAPERDLEKEIKFHEELFERLKEKARLYIEEKVGEVKTDLVKSVDRKLYNFKRS